MYHDDADFSVPNRHQLSGNLMIRAVVVFDLIIFIDGACSVPGGRLLVVLGILGTTNSRSAAAWVPI